MRPHDMGTLFDEAAAGGARTVVHLDRPFDIAPRAGTRWTVTELADLVRATAARLADAGVRPGDRVAIVKDNHWDYDLLACAAVRLGAVPALLSARLDTANLVTLLERLRPAALVTTAAVLARCRDTAAGEPARIARHRRLRRARRGPPGRAGRVPPLRTGAAPRRRTAGHPSHLGDDRRAQAGGSLHADTRAQAGPLRSGALSGHRHPPGRRPGQRQRLRTRTHLLLDGRGHVARARRDRDPHRRRPARPPTRCYGPTRRLSSRPCPPPTSGCGRSPPGWTTPSGASACTSAPTTPCIRRPCART